MQLRSKGGSPPQIGFHTAWLVAGAGVILGLILVAAVLLPDWSAPFPAGIELPLLAGPFREYETMFTDILCVEVAHTADQRRGRSQERDPTDFLYRVRSQILTREELDPEMLRHAARDVDPRGRSNMEVAIACDADLPFAATRGVLESCRQARIWRIWMLGRKRDSSMPGGWQVRFQPLPWHERSPPTEGDDDDVSAPPSLILHLDAAGAGSDACRVLLEEETLADLASLAPALVRRLPAGYDLRQMELTIHPRDDVLWRHVVLAICAADRALGGLDRVALE